MLLDISQRDNSIIVSYFDKNGNTNFKTYELEHPKRYNWFIGARKNGVDKTYRNWDGKPVSKGYANKLNRYRLIEFIESLPKEDYDEIFEYNFPKAYFIDIEVEVTDEFPEPSLAKNEITTIAIVSPNKMCTVFGTKELDKSANIEKQLNEHFKDVLNEGDKIEFQYKKFNSEYDLLYTFLRAVSKMPMISGWNFIKFDWEYIKNRADNLGIDPGISSPVGELMASGLPMHVGVIDYLEIYSKWDRTVAIKENMKLDTAGNDVLGIKKIKYDGTLQNLYEQEYTKYVFYNAVDTVLVHMIHEKIKTMDIALTIAHLSQISIAKASSPVAITESLLCREFLQENKVMAIQKREDVKDVKYEGAFVKEPILGMHSAVACFDFASLYPSVMRQMNVSPESFVKKVAPSARENELADDKIVSVTGAVYEKKESVLKRILSRLYSKRKEYKKLSFKYQQDFYQLEKKDPTNKELNNLKDLKDKYYNFEQAVKLMLNSIYGAFGNKWFYFFNVDIAETITLQGKDAILYTERLVNQYFKDFWHKDKALHKKMGIEVTGQIEEPVSIYIDTDSIYMKFEEVISKTNWKKSSKEFILLLYELRFKEYLEKILHKYAEKNNSDNFLFFEMESIAKNAIWLAKKNYIQNISWKDPDLDYDDLSKISIKGFDTVKSSTPLFARNKLKELITYILSVGNDFDISKFLDMLKEIRREFEVTNIDHISFSKKVNNYQKYIADDYSVFDIRKGCPINVRAAGYHNYLLNNSQLRGKYQAIGNGEKIKYYHSSDVNCDIFGYLPGSHPYEFAAEIDYDVQFEKTILSPINRVISAMGFKTFNKNLIYIHTSELF